MKGEGFTYSIRKNLGAENSINNRVQPLVGSHQLSESLWYPRPRYVAPKASAKECRPLASELIVLSLCVSFSTLLFSVLISTT